MNNPLRYTDPNGEWLHIAIGALAGGFATGFAAAAFSYMAATPILTGGNHIAFGDPLPTPKQYALGLGLSALGGGITQGLGALSQGNRFLDGGMTAAERSMINNAQVSAINEVQGHHMPNAASSDIDGVLMERIGHRQVNNFLNNKTVISQKTIYRAVDATENISINNTKSFLLQEGGTEVKYFAKSLDNAHWYGKKLYPDGYNIIQGTIKSNININNYWYPYTDIGAYTFPRNILPHIKPVIP